MSDKNLKLQSLSGLTGVWLHLKPVRAESPIIGHRLNLQPDMMPIAKIRKKTKTKNRKASESPSCTDIACRQAKLQGASS